MPKLEVNHTVEDYLRSIYRLECREGKVSNAALARELGISTAAVTEMVRRLAELGFLAYKKYQAATLTDAGRDRAVEITRRHRLWEVFLRNQLGFGWDEVHAIADQLEHVSSDVLIDRLDTFLGHPTHDPHGDAIPSREGVVEERSLVALFDVSIGAPCTVERVSDEHPELLRYAATLGLELKMPVRVEEIFPFDQSVRVTADGRETVISQMLAQNIFVLPVIGAV